MESRRRARSGVGGIVHYASLPIVFISAQVIILLAIIISIVSSAPVTNIDTTNMEIIIYVGSGAAFGLLLIVEFALGSTMNLVTVALSAPLISGEIELKSWELLRATALSLREILMAKAAATLHQLRLPLLGLMIIRTICTGAGVFLAVALVMGEVRYDFRDGLDPHDYEYFVEWWLPILVAVLVVALVHFLQPVLQMLLNTALGMTASAFARTRGRALAVGIGSRLALWGITGVLGAVGISLTINAYDRWLWNYSGYPGNEATVISLLIITWALIFLVVQIGITLIAWGLTVRRARRLTEMT